MDLAYWGFRHWPFERSFSTDRLFSGALHEEALARLFYLMEENRRSGILMGPTGTGKTFLLKTLQHRAERMGRITVRCDATGLNGHELASQIALACHVLRDPDSSSLKVWNGLNQRFSALSLIQQPLMIIVDHYDFVDSTCLNTISRLNHLADATGATMSVVIGTRETLIPTSLNDLMELKIEIGPWTVEECFDFISRAVIYAGSMTRPFTEESVNLIHELTGGVPASVVSLCHLSLLAAMECSEHQVTQEIVEEISSEFSSRGDRQHRLKPFSITSQMSTN